MINLDDLPRNTLATRKFTKGLLDDGIDPLNYCLDVLSQLSSQGKMELFGNSYWNLFDREYQRIALKREFSGDDVSEYRKRYDKILMQGVPDVSNLGKFNRFDTRPAIGCLFIGGER